MVVREVDSSENVAPIVLVHNCTARVAPNELLPKGRDGVRREGVVATW